MIIFFIMMFMIRNAPEFAQGLSTGVFSGMLLVAVFNTIRIYKALNDEKLLKEMYIKDTDERNIAIQKEAATVSAKLSSYLTGIAVIIAGFFNKTVCITLGVAALCEALLVIGITAYYNKKM